MSIQMREMDPPVSRVRNGREVTVLVVTRVTIVTRLGWRKGEQRGILERFVGGVTVDRTGTGHCGKPREGGWLGLAGENS